MKRLLCFLIAQVLIIQITKTQENFSATISANNIEAVVNSNGATIVSFKNKSLPGGDAQISTLRASGLWITGLDALSNLIGSIQVENENGKADFQTHPDFQNIWKVKRSEILAHRSDYEDNMEIDNPIPAIFDWPSAVITAAPLSSFWDNNNTGEYEPGFGNFPTVEIRDCYNENIPNEMTFSAFNDGIMHTQTNLMPLNLHFGQTVFAYNCTDSEVLSKTIFIKYKIRSHSIQTMTNVRIGMYNDFQIGCNEDDFIGSIPARGIQYAYNAGTTDCAGGFINNPSVHVVQILRGPNTLKSFGENGELINTEPGQQADTVVYAQADIFLPIGHEDSNIQIPQSDLDYFNLMNGVVGNENITALYTGDPTDPLANSERTENNTPGKRRTITSFEPIFIKTGSVNEFVVAHTIYGGGNMSTDEALKLMQTNTEVEDAFNSCFRNACTQVVTSSSSLLTGSPISIYPNPATDQVFIKHDKPIEEIKIYNLLGQNLTATWKNNTVNVSGLPNGHYIIQMSSDGIDYVEKLVVGK